MNTVLVVDDEPSILRSVERTFHDADLRILTADSGEQALEILGQEKIAVVVSDNRMPGMSGIDLLTRVRTISPDTVRIMMTAFAVRSTMQEFTGSFFDPHLMELFMPIAEKVCAQ